MEIPPPNEFAQAARQLQLPYVDEDYHFDNIDPELLVGIGRNCRDGGLIFKISQVCSYAASKGAVPEASGTALALSAKTTSGPLNIGKRSNMTIPIKPGSICKDNTR